MHEQLRELLHTKVFPALAKYNASQSEPRFWVQQGEPPELMVDTCVATDLKGDLSCDVWVFNDHMAHRAMPDRAKALVGALGVSQDMFWCLVLAYAMYDGLRDYKTHHGGNLPDNSAAYLYAVLTSEDLASTVQEDF